MDGDANPQEPTEILPEHDETVVLDAGRRDGSPTGWGPTRDSAEAAATQAMPPAKAPDSAGPSARPEKPWGYTIPEQVRDAAPSANEARTRSALIIVAVVAGLVLLAGLVAAVVTRPSPATTTSTAIPSTSVTTAAPTTTAPPTSLASTTTEAPETTKAPPPAPNVTITASPAERICGAEAAETTAVVSWSTSDASQVTVVGPTGSLSSEKSGSRIVGPSQPCGDIAPGGLVDTYAATGQNVSGVTQRQATVRWLPSN